MDPSSTCRMIKGHLPHLILSHLSLLHLVRQANILLSAMRSNELKHLCRVVIPKCTNGGNRCNECFYNLELMEGTLHRM